MHVFDIAFLFCQLNVDDPLRLISLDEGIFSTLIFILSLVFIFWP